MKTDLEKYIAAIPPERRERFMALHSLVMGLCFALLVERMISGPEWRAVIMIGLLGAFTTFSTFSIETLNLLEDGELYKALSNMLLSVVLCLLSAWVGLVIGRQ